MSPQRWLVAISCSGLLGVTVAFGAPERPPPAGIDFRKNISLTPEETLKQSQEYLNNMRFTARDITSLSQEAQKHRDIVKLNCLNDKLAQVQGHVTVADEAMTALNNAIAARDDGGRQHVFTRITILYQKVEILRTEAQQCIGDDISYVGETRVEVEVDPSIPPEDPTQPPVGVPPIVARPPEATPFM